MDQRDDGEPFVAVDVALVRGRSEIDAGRPDEARRVLVAALDELGGDGDTRGSERSPAAGRRRATALRLLALAEFDTAGTDPAIARLDDAAEAAARVGDGELVALTWAARATVLGRSGLLEDALAALDEATAGIASLDPRDRATVRMNRGVARSQVGDLDGAGSDLAEAAAIARTHDLRTTRFMALHNLGYVHHLLGDAPAALRAMHEADAIEVDVSRGVSLLDRGRVLLEAGIVDDAATTLEEAVAVCRGDGQQHTEAEAWYELGRTAVLLGRPTEALAHVAHAADRFDRRTAAGWVLRCRLAELRISLRQLHRDASGEPTVGAGDEERARDDGAARLAAAARRLVAEAAGGGAAIARAARVLAAEAAALAGDVAGATELLPDGAPVPLLTARLDEHRARAALALARRDAADARRVLRTAADDLAAASLSATTLDLRTARLAHATVLAELDLSLAIAEGPLAALAAVDRWRASSTRLPPVRPTTSTEIAQLLTLRRRLRDELRDAPPDRTDAWTELARVERLIAVHRRTADAREGRAGSGATTPVALDELLTGLVDEGRDLLVTATHRGEVLTVTVVDGRAELRTVGTVDEVGGLARRVRADLGMLATRRLGALEGAVTASLTAGAAALSELLLGPAAGRDARLLVVAHGELIALPWGLLAPGRPVALASSPSAWWRAHTAATPPAADGPTVRIVRGPRLVGADDEARRVAAAWGIDAPSDDAAAGALVAAVADADLVHVVAHGQHHRQQPLFSSLALADGPCSLYDLEAGGVAATQVVLAACDAGRATVRPGDEPLGLAAGLLALGARCVVAPVTPVPDELLPAIMGALHDALAAGHATDEALALATADAPPVAGAFVVSGAPVRTGRPAGGAGTTGT